MTFNNFIQYILEGEIKYGCLANQMRTPYTQLCPLLLRLTMEKAREKVKLNYGIIF